jgi:peptidoglycan/LPS O-acetylase OafA/YrhL
MSATRRIDGIDLFRGIAAFAVVILHSDEGIKIAPKGWSFFLNFSAFAVPFFLATSFFLLVDKIGNSATPIKWIDRFSRLLIPYGFWSAVYLGIKILQFSLKKQPHKLQLLLENWPGLIFLGQSGFHLYFIPLLISGILVVIAAESFIRSRPSLLFSIFLLFLCIFVYQNYLLLDFSDPNTSGWLEKINVDKVDREVLTFFVRLLGFFLRCSSYIAVALICSRLMIRDKLLNLRFTGFLVCFILFVTVNAFSAFVMLRDVHEILPKVVEELLKGYITLALAFVSSSYIRDSSIVSSLGRCSFGIYLMHLAFLQILWSFANKFGLNFDNPSLSMLIFSVIFAYFSSWLTTHLLMQKKDISKIIFGA